MIDRGKLSDRQKELAKRIFTRLGEAEAKVHGTTIQKVHFHEVGAVDSIADIVGTAIAFDLLGIERVVSSAVPTGCGFIEIAHGRCSLPAPATAELLAGVPLAASTIEAELTTPTGAAILAALVSEYGPPPPMTIRKIGYGAGGRDLAEQPNLLRILIGDSAEAAALYDVEGDTVWVLETNLDDATGEAIGHCIERLWAAGALDVYTTAIQMKKNRPGVTLTVLCGESKVTALERTLFRETTTLGVRRWSAGRHKLARRPGIVETPWGPVEGMWAKFENMSRFSPEFESCRAVAEANQLSLPEVFAAAAAAAVGNREK
jgi:uncharacterized protein (TIGR00299 family) protein